MRKVMLGVAACFAVVAQIALAEPKAAIALYGEPVLMANFNHFPYANIDAPKKGTITFGVMGTFDTLNPYSVRGIAAQGIAPPMGLVIQSLMVRSADEPFSLYASIAQSVDISIDLSAVTFHIDPRAHFSDGIPLTSADVIFSWSLLKEKGKPNLRGYYNKVVSVDAPDPLTVIFKLGDGHDRELPMILALMPILAKHTTDTEHFDETTLKAPIGSGPYVVSDVKAGESIIYRRDPKFWGMDLPVNKGMYNADAYRYDYYRDANTLFEAFKAGLYDVRSEDNPTRWVTGYDFPRMLDGRAVKDPISVRTPKGMAGLVFNTRRPVFADIRTREALSYLFDFEWINTVLFEGVYKRTGSYFEGSDLSTTGTPATKGERSILAPYPEAVRSDILEGQWHPPFSDGSGRDRANARKAFELLQAAGWSLNKGTMTNTKGNALDFEIVVVSRVQERLALNFSESLQRLGIKMTVRLVDDVQYWQRVSAFDFDMIQFTWGASPSPGNEQYNRWGSRSKDRQGSLNYAGASNPAIDAAIDAMLGAPSRDAWLDAVHALDRVLISGFYVVPLFHAPEQWIVRNAAVKRPDYTPLFGFAPETLWRED
ncbi:MAG: extracellular solute-binding protein [Beijerinckiaceae bacterium]|nr:extracellular solute-binding protein [Beijerinckiaceae bacterium]